MARISCLLLAVGLAPLSSCLRLNVGNDAATMRPAVSSDDTVFGSVKLSEAGDWSYESGHVAGAQFVFTRNSSSSQKKFHKGVSPLYAQELPQREPLAGSVARGSFKDAVHTPSNFGQFHVETFGNFPDSHQLYAAGYLEGYLTAGGHSSKCALFDQWTASV